MTNINFKARIHPLRLFSGETCLEYLPQELQRKGVNRALILSGRSISKKTNLLNNIESLIINRFAGRFSEVDRHCSESSMLKAVQIAKNLRIDAIVAVGSGTVCMAARIIAMAYAENLTFDELATRYLSRGGPVSPRLYKPKIPIWNILTTATLAQNGAGATLKSQSDNLRLELFDPKTRPTGVFWDGNALTTAPEAVSRAAGLTILWFSMMRMGGISQANPLVQADRYQAWQLALESISHLGTPLNTSARIKMCAASFLLNRDFDHGGLPFEVHWVARVCYALGAGLLSINDAISPGEVYLALTGPAIVLFGDRDLNKLREICTFLPYADLELVQTWDLDDINSAINNFFISKNFGIKLSSLGITSDHLPRIRDIALRNFNSDPYGEFSLEIDLLDQVLKLAL